MKKVSIIHNTSATASTAYLLNSLLEAVSRSSECKLYHYDIKSGVVGKIKHFVVPRFSIWRGTIRADVLIIHTSVIFSLTQVLIAKLTKTKIVVIFWDAYPDSFIKFRSGKNVKLFRIYAQLETRILRAANVVLLPSENYLKVTQDIGPEKSTVFPLWPFSAISDPITKRRDPNALHIGFAGTLNVIRGLPDAIQRLGASFVGKIVLHLYSSGQFDMPKAELPQNIEIVEHGYVDQDLLVTELKQLDAGLVCLHPDFDLPAFPSKIVSYVSSGIPVVYSGPTQTGISSFLEKYHVGISLPSSQCVDREKELLSIKSNFIENQKKAMSYLELTEEKLAQIL